MPQNTKPPPLRIVRGELVPNESEPDWDTIDRCGAGRFSTSPETEPFLEDCTEHDHEYLEGGTVEEMVRADNRFHRGIWRKAVAGCRAGAVTCVKLALRATFFSAIVELTGRYFWTTWNRLKGKKPPPKPKPQIIRTDD